jgi:predicted metal-dependent enzyme (double-stranded beta helix superfamily)
MTTLTHDVVVTPRELALPAPATPGRYSLDQLDALVAELVADTAYWQPLLHDSDRDRWWVRLHTDDNVDLWLIVWGPGSGTDLHDHGDSDAAFAVASGELAEVQLGPDGELVRTTLAADASRRVAAHVVHDVNGSAPGRSVSVHAYSPPLTQMTYYDRAPDGVRARQTVITDVPESDEEAAR